MAFTKRRRWSWFGGETMCEKVERVRHCRPQLEVLEDRTLLAPLMVTNANDSGAGSLRDVLANAASGSVINFAAGLANGTINLQTPIQFGIGANGKPNGATNLTVDGQKLGITINGQTKTSLFEIMAGNDTISNLKLTEGNGTDGKGNSQDGGAILVDKAATLSLNNDTLKSNTANAQDASTNGGAIENDGALNTSGCTFTGNSTTGSGGAIENTGVANINGVASTFTGNRASKQGGAIDSRGSVSLNVSLATFYDNQAPSGGAISTASNTTLTNDVFGGTGANQPNQATDANGMGGGAVFANNSAANNLLLTVLASQFIGNTSADVGGGGGIKARNFNTDVEQSTFNQNQATMPAYGGGMAISDSGDKGPGTIRHQFNLDTFSNNQANEGGALGISDSATATAVNVFLYNSTFYKNHAVDRKIPANGGQGGGVYIVDTLAGSGSATDTLTNDTFFMNDSTDLGGALYVALSTTGTASPSVLLTSQTVNNNTAANDGGGLYVDSKLQKAVTLDNNILDGNTVSANAKQAQDVTLVNGATLSEQYNLLGTTNNNNFTNNVNNDILSNTTGLAGALAANGAPATYPQTLALTAVKGVGSPGYETGDPALATSGKKPLNQDERGVTRQVGKVSMGAEDPDGKYAAAMSINSSVNPALLGQPVTLTAAVTSDGGIPTGTVTFYDGPTELDTVTLDANGNAAYTTSSLALGIHNITAVYSGDSNFIGITDSFTQVISQETSDSISLSSSANPSALNQAVTFTATVTGGSGTPTGSVTFMDGDTVLGTAPLGGNGNATLTMSALALGSHTITAVYSGDGTYGSNSASLTQQVNQVGSTTYLSSSNSNTPPNQSVTFTATVMGQDGGTPTGTVTFLDGTTELGSGTLNGVSGNDQATFSISTLALGTHDIIAIYNGDSTYSDSDASLTQNISLTASGTILTSSVNPSQSGQAVTFTATVTGQDNGAPTGTVTFLDGTTVLGTGTLNGVSGNDQATFSTSALATGNHTITAICGGDGTYAGSDGWLTQTVGQASGTGSSTYLTSSAGSAQPGQTVTFTAIVTGMGGTPTGTVTFQDGTTVLGTGTLSVVNGQNQATFSTSTLALGTHNIIALYGGDSSFNTSQSSLTETISLASTTTSLSSSASPALAGQPVTLTATIGSMSGGTPTGTVTFYDGLTVLGTGSVTVVNGQAQATLITSFWGPGSHAIFAVYSGDGTYAVSSSSLTQQVNQGGTTTSLTSSANPSPQGQSVMFTATVSAGLGAGTPTGTVSFYDGTTFLGTGTLTWVNGQMQATFTTAALGLGSHTIIAVYSGDSTFADSGASLQQTIS